MTRGWYAIALTLLSVAVLVACAWGGTAGELLFGVLMMAFAPLLMLLGAARAGSAGRALLPILLLLGVLEASLAGLWIFRGEVESGPWWLGLPAATAIQLYALLAPPLAIVTLGFARAFRRFDVSAEDLEALRRLAPAGEE